MFILKYEKFLQNSMFEKNNIEYAREDFHYFNKNAFSVADGVTRDLNNGEASFYPKTKEEALYLKKNYSNETGTFEVAKTIVINFVNYANNLKSINIDSIKNIINKINMNIWALNKDRMIDYLINDLYGAVAVGGIIDNNILYCFGIGDCYIKCYDKNYMEIFSTENDHLWSYDIQKNFLTSEGFSWKDSRFRVFVRAALRNNSIIKYKGKSAGFGVLTGEKNALDFVKVYKVPLNKIKYICAYTDGCMPYFLDENIKKTLLNPKIIENEGVERSIMIFEDKNK